MSTTTVAAHPYADAWPMLGGEELDELAGDIAANGLRESVVVYGDKILDGRNRYAACKKAGVEPSYAAFHGTDDDALAYVQSVNNGRRHQSKGSLAASWALSMLAASKRDDGRWAYGANSENSQNLTGRMRADLGVIADHAADLLLKVRDDEMSLNAAHGHAEQARDAERNRLDREERIAAEEAEAKSFVEQNAPDIAAHVGGAYESYAEALAVWEKRNREEADKIAREKAAKAKAEREHKAAMTDHYSHQMARALSTLGGYGAREDPLDVMAEFSPAYLDPPQMERFFTVDNLRNARRFIDALIESKEQK